MRFLIITGVGRSGTSILGKVVGSMTPAYYVFEPAIMKFPSLWEYGGESFLRVLYEDYLLPVVQARGNCNPMDLSYMGNYDEKIAYRWAYLRRRADADKYVKAENPLWVIKMPEFQPYMERWLQLAQSTCYIHIIRNGLDVVNSMVSQGWYTDKYCNDAMVEVTHNRGVCVPHFIPEHEHRMWQTANVATRAACVWRNLICSGISKQTETVFFETLCENPKKYLEVIASWLKLYPTELTSDHIKSVKKPTPTTTVSVNDIAQPEKEKFIETNERLGYTVN